MDATPTDEQLMLDYAGGSYRAFETLYARYKAPILRFYRQQARPPAAAEELLHEAFMRLIRARESYRPVASFRLWFWRIVRNLLIDHQRSNQRSLPEINPEQQPEPADPRHSPEQQTARHQQQLRLMELLRQLPAEQRDAFLLKEEAGLSLAEIADLSGVGTETIKSRLRYAIAKLRLALEDSV